MSENVPNDLLYTEDHEWARQEGNLVTIGITQFAVDQLGDVTQVDLPNEGEVMKPHEVLGSVESVKAVSDVYAPVSGKVVRSTPRCRIPQNTSTRNPTTAAGWRRSSCPTLMS